MRTQRRTQPDGRGPDEVALAGADPRPLRGLGAAEEINPNAVAVLEELGIDVAGRSEELLGALA